MNVQRGKPHVLGPVPTAAGLLLIEVPLDPHPDEHWAAIFGGENRSGVFSGPPGFPHLTSMHPPALHGATARLRVPDAEIDKNIELLDERIRLTNAEYERKVAPRLKLQRDAEERAWEQERRRVEEAQRRLDEL